MAQATVDHTMIIRCPALADYQAALAKLALYTAQGNQPPIQSVTPFQNQLRINVVYAQQTVEFS